MWRSGEIRRVDAMREIGKLRRRDFFRFVAAAVAAVLTAAVYSRAGGDSCPGGLRRPGADGFSMTDRLILRLYYYEEMSPREIGAVLDLSEAQVRRRHSAVLERMRAAVGTA